MIYSSRQVIYDFESKTLHLEVGREEEVARIGLQAKQVTKDLDGRSVVMVKPKVSFNS